MSKLAIASCAVLAFAALGAPAADAASISVDGQLISTVATGTPPLAVDSTTRVDELNADLLDGLTASQFARGVSNVVRVGPDGPFTSIQAALDSITDASLSKIYLVLVSPGFYNEALTLKDFVLVMGYHRDLTILQADLPGSFAAVQGSPFGFLANLTVYASSTSGGNVVGIQAPIGDSENLVITATGSATGQATGMRVTGSDFVRLRDVELRAQDGTVNTALYMETPASVTLDGGGLRAFANAGGTSYGVRRAFVSDIGTLDLEDVTVIASGGAVSYAIRSEKGSLGLRRCSVSSDGSTTSVGVYNGQSTTYTIEDTSIFAGGTAPGASRIAFENAAGTVFVRRSQLQGGYTVFASAGSTVRLAYNQIFGTLGGTGTYQCIGNHDLGMVAVSCP